MWLNELPLFPFRDLSKPTSGASSHQIDNLVSAPISDTKPIVNISQMSEVSNDGQVAKISLGRCFINAFFIGQDFGAKYFQDAIMNGIIKTFRPDMPPSVDLVADVYKRTCLSSGVSGLKVCTPLGTPEPIPAKKLDAN